MFFRPILLALAISASLPSLTSAATFLAHLSRTDTGDATPGDGTCADSQGICTFRAAVDEANASPGRDAITFTILPPSAAYGVVATKVIVSEDLDIIGNGRASTVIYGQKLDRVIDIPAGVHVTISDVTLGQGQSDDGGLIRNLGDLTLTRVTLKNGKAKRGGGLFSTGTLAVSDTYFYQLIGQAYDSLGGAIYNDGAALLERVTIHKGQAVVGCGGGIYNGPAGTMDLTNATFFKNTARVGSGAGICNAGALRCTNCTLSRNRATTIGGGILVESGTVELFNTLLDGNRAAQDQGTNNCGGLAVTSLGYNLDSSGTCGLHATGDIANVIPGVRDLDTPSGALIPIAPFKLATSPAIDAGSAIGCPATDAIGQPRPVGLSCDIGALEHQAPAVTPVPTATATPTVPTATATSTLPPATATPTTAPPTATPSRTSTPTPQPGTPTPTPTDTITPTPTASFTATPTPTETGTPTETATPTITETPTVTPTATNTSTPLPPGEFWVDMKASDTSDASPGDGVCANADGECSLRAAIEEANASPLHGTIHLPEGLAKIRSELVATGDFDIVGAGMYASEVTASYKTRSLRIASGASVGLYELTLSKGLAEEGGLLYNEGTLVVNRTHLNRGTALRGAGLLNAATASITDSFFDGCRDQPPAGLGGCIHNRGNLMINRVTLKRGQARKGCGGGIYNAGGGLVDAVNLTIMRNRARRARAGGICNDGGTLRCTNCTIARNQANNTSGGILNLSGTIELKNTLVVSNWNAGERHSNCAGDGIISLGNNLDSGHTCGFDQPGDLSDVDPGLRGLHFVDSDIPVGAFEDSTSAAVDAADGLTCPSVDERGLPRPSGPGCDIGAFELQVP